MRIIIKLNKKEISFLKALKEKTYPVNAFSGRMSDDSFRKKWNKEIKSFMEAGLFDKANNGLDAFWQFNLNKKGLKLQDKHIKT